MPDRHQPKHLRFIRGLPCCTCGRAAPSEAAHVRMSTFGGVTVPLDERGGTGLKSADSRSVPLCAWCHRLNKDSQHNMGERPFWEKHGINPLELARSLYANTGNLDACRGIVGRARMRAAI